jgi:hypothetical protein
MGKHNAKIAKVVVPKIIFSMQEVMSTENSFLRAKSLMQHTTEML